MIKYLVFIVVLTPSCEREPLPDELPPITMTGENTFGCLINDEVFVPVIRRWTGPDGILGAIVFSDLPAYPDYIFSVSAHRLAENDEKIKDIDLLFIANNVEDTGEYDFSYISLEYRGKHYGYIINGTIDILFFDTIAEVISGTFNANVYNEIDTVQITYGRFDLKVTP